MVGERHLDKVPFEIFLCIVTLLLDYYLDGSWQLIFWTSLYSDTCVLFDAIYDEISVLVTI